MWQYILGCIGVIVAFFGGYYTATDHYLVALEDTQKRLTNERMQLQAEQLKKSNNIYQELNTKYQQSLNEKNEIEKQFNNLVSELDADRVLNPNTSSSDAEPVPSDTRTTAGTEQGKANRCTNKDLRDLKKDLLAIARDYDTCATDYNKLLEFYRLLKEQYN